MLKFNKSLLKIKAYISKKAIQPYVFQKENVLLILVLSAVLNN